MAISQLQTSIVPNEQLTLTPEGAMKEIENFIFAGPGWYVTDLGSMLVVGTDAVNTYIFSIFYGRDPRPANKAIATAPVNVKTSLIGSKTTKPMAPNKPLLYWGGIIFFWMLALLIGNKWGFKAEIPVLFIMIMWPTAIRRWFRKTEEKTNAKL